MKKYQIIIAIIILIIPSYIVLASSKNLTNAERIAELKASIEKNSSTIEYLKWINTWLQKEILQLSWTWVTETKINSWVTVTTTWTWIKASSVEKYNILINKINLISQDIFTEYKLGTGSSIWLFEFIEPSNFFISIDDWKNPSWVTAFKKKILYTYDSSYNLTVSWTFDLDYKTQYYVTKTGKNPFAKATRIKIKNPQYNGKLLEINTDTTWTWTTTNTSSNTTTNSSSNSSTTTTTTSTVNVTAEDVATAYTNNKILDAIKLSNEYIKKDPNNAAVLKIRYRSYAIVGKYVEALVEVEKYIQVKWNSVEKWVYCEAKNIWKLWKNTTATNKYTPLCASK